jgi:hypothetical protein
MDLRRFTCPSTGRHKYPCMDSNRGINDLRERRIAKFCVFKAGLAGSPFWMLFELFASARVGLEERYLRACNSTFRS